MNKKIEAQIERDCREHFGNQMFIDYDHCHDRETDTDKYCKYCTEIQQRKCQKENQ